MESDIALEYVEINDCQSDIIKERSGQSIVTYLNALYIFGGEFEELVKPRTCLNNLLRYDLTTNSWSEEITIGTPPSPRFGHSAVVYKSLMFIFGGHGSPNLCNDLYQYEFSTKLWTRVEITGRQIPHARWRHTATVHDDRMWIFGGQSTRKGSKYKKKRPSDLWSIRLSVGKPHWEKIKNKDDVYVQQGVNTPVAVVGDKMYILMLTLTNFSPTYELFVCNLKEQTWSYAEETPVKHSRYTAMVVFDQKLVVFGSIVDCYCYDLCSEVWSTLNICSNISRVAISKPSLVELSNANITVCHDAIYCFGYRFYPIDRRNTAMYKIDYKRIYPKCNIIEDYGKLFYTREFADVEFLVGEKQVKIKAHIAISAARSQWLLSLLEEAIETRVNDSMLQVQIPNEAPEIFEKMLKYMYTDQIDPPSEGIDDWFLYLDLYNLAMEIGLERLQHLIMSKFFDMFPESSLTLSHVLQILSKAHNMELLAIKGYILSNFVYDFKDEMDRPEFKTMDKALIEEIKTNIDPDIFASYSLPSEGSTLVQDMEEFLNLEEFSDVAILAPGCRIPAHKCILAARCSFFEAMFRSFNPPDNTIRIQICEMIQSEEVVTVLLKYIYYGHAKFPIELSLPLFAASGFYGFTTNRLQEMVKANLEIHGTFEQIVQILEEAHVSNQIDMKQFLLPLVVKLCPDLSSWVMSQTISHELLIEICKSNGIEELGFLDAPANKKLKLP